MVEEVDVEKWNFQKFRRSVTLTLTLDQVKVTAPSRSLLATHQLHSFPSLLATMFYLNIQ